MSETMINGKKYVFFWMDDEYNGYLSNWYRAPFVLDDFIYHSTEQYFIAQKAKLFHDAERYTAILKAETGRECKALGRQVTPFDGEKWGEVSYEIMKTANREKFRQNPPLKLLLLATGDSILAESNPGDAIWGIRLDAETAKTVPPENWPGQNLQGKLLMELREELAEEEN